MSQHTIYISVITTVSVLVVLMLLLLIYYLLYSRHLKKAVAKGHADHPMPRISFFSVMLLCIVFLSAEVFTVTGLIATGQQLDKLSEAQEDIQQKVTDQSNFLGRQYDLLYSVKDELRKDDLLERASFTYGDYHPKTQSVDATIEVIPKAAASTDKVTFYYEDQEIKLSWKGKGIFSGSFQADVLNTKMQGLLVIENGKIAQSQIIRDEADFGKDLDDSELNIAHYIPTIYFSCNEIDPADYIVPGQRYQEKKDPEHHTLQYMEDYIVFIEPPSLNKNFEAASVKLLCQLNGKTIEERDLTEDYRKGTKDESTGRVVIPSVKVNQTIENYQEGDELKVLISVTDTDGYTYLKEFYCSNDTTIVYYEESPQIFDSRMQKVTVLDKDGNELEKRALTLIYSAESTEQ